MNTSYNTRFSAMLAEGSSIGFVSLFTTRYRQKNKYQLKQLICTSIKHAASVPAESFSNTSTAESRVRCLQAFRTAKTNYYALLTLGTTKHWTISVFCCNLF